ncbi:hypothetical protein L208DRAFT_1299996 [Tricholoma matsutake]|nr:hypothetical protein L208DRAFT_1299996 [Tricholoma matsutake 945]
MVRGVRSFWIVNNHSVGEDSTVLLRYLPSVIIFWPLHCTFPHFPGLQEGLIPIFPAERKFTIQGHSGGKIKVTQRQLAFTAGYAFTDYKAQGQTLEHVIVDLAKPPRGSITPFRAYVALSCSRGRDTIRLLWDFNDTLLTTHPSQMLHEEDQRLRGLAAETEKWKI